MNKTPYYNLWLGASLGSLTTAVAAESHTMAAWAVVSGLAVVVAWLSERVATRRND